MELRSPRKNRQAWWSHCDPTPQEVMTRYLRQTGQSRPPGGGDGISVASWPSMTATASEVQVQQEALVKWRRTNKVSHINFRPPEADSHSYICMLTHTHMCVPTDMRTCTTYIHADKQTNTLQEFNSKFLNPEK